jgi:hypothetical protein
VSLIFIHESDTILGGLGGFHCSLIGSIVVVVILGIVYKVVVLMVLMVVLKPEAEVNKVLCQSDAYLIDKKDHSDAIPIPT